MTPTILNAMGVSFSSLYQGKVSHTKMGLGRSLYSDDENLICRYGQDGLIKKLNERSSVLFESALSLGIFYELSSSYLSFDEKPDGDYNQSL